MIAHSAELVLLANCIRSKSCVLCITVDYLSGVLCAADGSEEKRRTENLKENTLTTNSGKTNIFTLFHKYLNYLKANGSYRDT